MFYRHIGLNLGYIFAGDSSDKDTLYQVCQFQNHHDETVIVPILNKNQVCGESIGVGVWKIFDPDEWERKDHVQRWNCVASIIVEDWDQLNHTIRQQLDPEKMTLMSVNTFLAQLGDDASDLDESFKSSRPGFLGELLANADGEPYSPIFSPCAKRRRGEEFQFDEELPQSQLEPLEQSQIDPNFVSRTKRRPLTSTWGLHRKKKVQPLTKQQLTRNTPVNHKVTSRRLKGTAPLTRLLQISYALKRFIVHSLSRLSHPRILNQTFCPYCRVSCRKSKKVTPVLV